MVLPVGHIVNNEYDIYICILSIHRYGSIYDMYVNLYIHTYPYHGSQKGGWEYACPFTSLRVSVYIC